jgi:DNA-binding NtrC family response regulator
MPRTDNSDGSKIHREAVVAVTDPTTAQALRAELEALGWRSILTNSVGPVRKLLKRQDIRLVILDGHALGEADAELIGLLKLQPDDAALLMLLSEQHRKSGPFLRGLEPDGILNEPADLDELRQFLSRLEEKTPEETASEILGQSEAIRQIKATIAQIAATPVSILITGESGTGKDLIAQAIHQHSPRRGGRFLTVNCGAIPESLLESELFGHEKGAFTDARSQRRGIFESADRGTVFLDEIGEMTLSAQVRLLRVLEAREITRVGSTTPIKVDVRVIAATNRDLRQAVEQHAFRRDLYYRLKVVEIAAPPLRGRVQDIPTLVQHFIRVYSEEHHVPPVALDDESMALLQSYRWPGNVRELKNLVERLMVLSVNRRVTPSDIRIHLVEMDGDLQLDQDIPSLPVRLGRSREESRWDLLYWAVLEVARDVKELKSLFTEGRQDARPVPIYQPDEGLLGVRDTEVAYTNGDEGPQQTEEIKTLQEVERETIARALQATGGHRKRAAKLLDMAERTLYRKIQQYNL